MKAWMVVGVTILIASAPAAALAQRGMRGTPARYDVATEVTLTGTVEEVKQVPAPGRGQGGLHLVFAAEGAVFDVHLGPAAFVESKSVAFAKGDQIVVTGSKAEPNVLLAREIKKGDQLLVLRDEKGFPLWSRRARQ